MRIRLCSWRSEAKLIGVSCIASIGVAQALLSVGCVALSAACAARSTDVASWRPPLQLELDARTSGVVTSSPPARRAVASACFMPFAPLEPIALLGAMYCGARERLPPACSARVEAGYPKRTLPFERARACARSTKSSRFSAALNRRVTRRMRAFSERRSSRPCLASRPKSTVAAIS